MVLASEGAAQANNWCCYYIRVPHVQTRNPYERSSLVQGLVEALYNLVQSVLYSFVVYFMVGFDLNPGVHCLPMPSHKPCSTSDLSHLPFAHCQG